MKIVRPISYGRGMCLPKNPAPKRQEEIMPPTQPVEKTTLKELQHIVQEKPANESLIKKLNGVKRVKRKISLIP